MRLRVSEGREHTIHGRLYKAGEEFDAPDKEAALWLATGLADKPIERTRAPVAQEQRPSHEVAAMESFKRGSGKPRRNETKEPAFYERKDMRAVDDE